MEVWTYRTTLEPGGSIADVGIDVSGYHVEATDGSIGKVDEATYETGRSYLVVDTGPWILGKKVMLPAGVVRGIDEHEQKVFVDRTKDEIKHAPEYDDTLVEDESYRGQLGSYYAEGYHEPDYGTRPPEESVM
jgi:hypothetical protein